jgi:hypothetical protein
MRGSGWTSSARTGTTEGNAMTLSSSLGLAMTVAALSVTSSTAATPYPPYYVDQHKIDNMLEAKGFPHNYGHVNVYSALCRGLRRHGVHTSDSGSLVYWRFKCDVVGVNQHYYTLNISTTLGPNGYWYWHILSARLEY